MDVRSPTLSVCPAAIVRGRNGLWFVSDELQVSNPILSARLAESAISWGVRPVNLVPTFNSTSPVPWGR